MQTVGGDETTRLLRGMGISSAMTTIIGLTAEDSPGEMSDYLAAGLDAVYKKPLLPKHWGMIARRYLVDYAPPRIPHQGGGSGSGGSAERSAAANGSAWPRGGAQPPLTPRGKPRRTTIQVSLFYLLIIRTPDILCESCSQFDLLPLYSYYI